MSLASWTQPPHPSLNLKTLFGLIEAWRTWDIEGMEWQFHPDSSHIILPASINRPVLSRSQYVEYLKLIQPMFGDMKVVIYDLHEFGDTMIVHAMYKSTSTTGVPYCNEVTVSLRFVPHPTNPSGRPKIIEIKEFVDSHYTIAWFMAERARQRLRVE